MSDILIRGMEMPIFEHQSWDIRHGDDGKWYIVDTNAETSDGEWHEIVHVQQHGRLIDADALVDSFDPSDFWNPDAEDNCFAAIHVVNCAPTVLEAEEGET